MMYDRYFLQKSLKYKPISFKKNTLSKVDSISNVISNKKVSIFEYEIFDNDNKVMIGKFKNRRIIKNGALLLADHNILSLIIIALHHKVLGYSNSYFRESLIYSNMDESLKKYLIKMYGTYTNKLLGKNFILLEKFNTNQDITKDKLKTILKYISDIHVHYYGDDSIVNTMMLNVYSVRDYKSNKKTLNIIFDVCKDGNIKDYGIDNYNKLKKFIKNIDIIYSKFVNHKTLTHNDFSNRNIYNNDSIYFYDWELACYQNPEHDLIDILVSNLKMFEDDEIVELIKYYRKTLYKNIKVKFSNEEYKELLLFNLKEYMVNKLGMLRVFNKSNHMKSIDMLSYNSNRLLGILEGIKL